MAPDPLTHLNAHLRVQLNRTQGPPGIVVLPAAGYRRVRRDLIAWPGYQPAPLHDLPELAAQAGVAALRLKDESRRLGVGGVELLGAAIAVPHILLAELARAGVALSATSADLEARRFDISPWIVTGAGSLRHGLAVAWSAHHFGARCRIIVPETTPAASLAAIEEYAAEIQLVPGSEDDAIDAAMASVEHDLLIAETARPGYTETPRLIMQAYRLMPDEAFEQWQAPPPTHVIVAAGNGAIAAAVSVQSRSAITPPPKLIVVATAPDFLAPAQANLLAWQELERATTAFLETAGTGDQQPPLAPSLAALLAAAADLPARAALGLDGQSRVLAFAPGSGA